MITQNQIHQLQEALDKGEVSSEVVETAAKQILENGGRLPDLTQGVGRSSLFSKLKKKLFRPHAGNQLGNIFNKALMLQEEGQSTRTEKVFGNLQGYFSPGLVRSSGDDSVGGVLAKLKLEQGSQEEEFDPAVTPRYLDRDELVDYVVGSSSEGKMQPKVGDLIVFKMGRENDQRRNVTVAGKLVGITRDTKGNHWFILEDQISSKSLPDEYGNNGFVKCVIPEKFRISTGQICTHHFVVVENKGGEEIQVQGLSRD